jgi:hypothetical protein
MFKRKSERETRIPSEREFGLAVDKQIEETFLALERDFEKSKNKYDRLPFHDRAHSEAVARRTKKILETIQASMPEAVSDRNIKLAQLIAANHDTVQNWQENTANGQRKRQRSVEQNEQASFEKLMEKLESVNKKSGQIFFTPDDLQIAREAIMVTIPGFDMKVGTVVQPKLSPESSIIARSVALADLGTAGMEDPAVFLVEGDALFREENLDILDAVENPDAVSGQIKKIYIDRMLAWTKFQPQFAAGRKLKLNEELQGLPPDAQLSVGQLFNRFDDSINAALALAQSREQRIKSGELDFETLAKEMGFVINTGVVKSHLPLAA